LRQSKTHLFPNSGLTNVIDRFLDGRRTFSELALPFAAVTMDVATGRAYPINSGPLVPALLATAAVPGIYAAVDHDGRRLYDGGVVANVPMRIALDMGARSLVVLDCAFPGQLPDTPETFAEILLFTALVTMRNQAVYEARVVAEQVPVVYLPGPTARRVSPLDFSHTEELIEAAYDAARPFLASLVVTGPGLYGGPAS
jgi:NTE family protein